MLDLDKSNEELQVDILDAEPAAVTNWLAPIICTILTSYFAWRYISIEPGGAFGAILWVIVVLIFPTAASMDTLESNRRFKDRWGIDFLIMWIISAIVFVALDRVMDGQYQNAIHMISN